MEIYAVHGEMEVTLRIPSQNVCGPHSGINDAETKTLPQKMRHEHKLI